MPNFIVPIEREMHKDKPLPNWSIAMGTVPSSNNRKKPISVSN